jgi:hypothetical protein
VVLVLVDLLLTSADVRHCSPAWLLGCCSPHDARSMARSSSTLLDVTFFTKRRKEQEETAARARGENVDYLVEDAPKEFRQQLWYAVDNAAGSLSSYEFSFLSSLQRYLCEEYGKPRLAGGADARMDLHKFIVHDASTHELMDVVDSVVLGLRGASQDSLMQYTAPRASIAFVETIRRRLREHKMAYDIVEGQAIHKQSEELHVNVVVPALTLLHGRGRFAGAEKQFRDALNELAAGNWADAVTDANATVENLLRTLTGFKQGQLPDLLAEARNRGIFGDPQSARIKKVVNGFSALVDVRNKEGDAHGNTSDEETAWLALYWAGALIVYVVRRAEAVGL